MMYESPRRKGSDSARTYLGCQEAREDIVALLRDELSPIRAEAVRAHLASCPDCREESLEIELAIRSYAKLPEVTPPIHLVNITLRRLNETYEPDCTRKPPRVRARKESSPESQRLPAEQKQPGILHRPVKHPFVWLAAAAFYLFVALSFALEELGDAVGRAQLKLLGPKLSEKLGQMTEQILLKM